MTQPLIPMCRTCGAMVEHPGRHREWHEALERLVPGLAAELEKTQGNGQPEQGFTF
ncbi:hypothetical protein ACFFMN_01925 [Planobispora siamensis]|uniref:Uncharacterized protein n=1 Tax=Planobispora siamensis TaxID=936338 RepID=A0A8J3SH48_9ACTN|nr:hypothetical protein [Planobispora siamensis]GIH92910.1 hypothetical protein Psi01_35400 [Planobispora siamensis]